MIYIKLVHTKKFFIPLFKPGKPKFAHIIEFRNIWYIFLNYLYILVVYFHIYNYTTFYKFLHLQGSRSNWSIFKIENMPLYCTFYKNICRF